MNNLKKWIITCVAFELVVFLTLTTTGYLPYEFAIDTICVLVIVAPLFLIGILEPIADYISKWLVHRPKE